VSVQVELVLNGARVPVVLDDEALRAIAELVRDALPTETTPASPFYTVREAAEFLRCDRQRVDDLLSQRRLTRVKDGARTLVRRDELLAYVETETRRRSR
jgi:excisionase family DNA binding protein